LNIEGLLEGRRAGDLALGLGGFLEGVFTAAFGAGFTDLAFKLADLAEALAGFPFFFAGLVLAFAFVAIGPATYTGYAS